MFKELEDFQNKARQSKERLDSFKSDLYSKRNELSRQQHLYQQMLDEEISGEKMHGISELNAITQRVADLEKEISIAEQRVQKLESGAAEQLAPLMKTLREGSERARSELNAELMPLFEEVREYRAQMLLTLQRASPLYAKLSAISEGMRSAEHLANASHDYRSNAIDIRELFNDVHPTAERGEKIGILPNAYEFMAAAHQGKVPNWVEAYKE